MKKLINAHFIIAICHSTMVFLILVGLFFVDIPHENMSLINTALGFTAGFVSAHVGYYFGKVENKEHEDINK